MQYVIGTIDKWDEYVAIFDNSELEERLFRGTDFLRQLMWGPLEEGRVIVAEDDNGEAIGIMVYNMKGMFGELPYLDLLGVKDGHRSKGIGKGLIELFLSLAKGLGPKKAFICTSDFNLGAKRLYESMGFKVIYLFDDLFGQGAAEYLFMKEI